MLIFNGACGFAEPPTNLALLSDISLETLVIVGEDVDDVVATETGTKTALFQFSDALPPFLALYILVIKFAMLLNV